MKQSTFLIVVLHIFVLCVGFIFYETTHKEMAPAIEIVPQPHAVEWAVADKVQKCSSFTDKDGTVQISCVDDNSGPEDIATVTAKVPASKVRCHGFHPSIDFKKLALLNVVCQGWSTAGVPQVLVDGQPIPDDLCAISCQDNNGFVVQLPSIE